ncbi:MAG: ATP-binding cassette domain-containing protein [Gammaproteobacteria bacterium]|nr:MAG: ATP-binding cassette domain-containing protein [Gammaproteobacteria bacterium]
MADLDQHDGELFLNGVSCQSMPASQWRKKVTLLPPDSQWWFDSVGEHFNHVDHDLLQCLGFPDEVLQWQVARLSTGEKQRLALLRLLQNQPEVILLDEPTANLDANNEKAFERVVADYLLQHQACAIWISHDIEQLGRVCQRHYEMSNGQLKECMCLSN